MCKVKTNLPLLSIRLMVFNHADFLEECLNSINEQKTNFKFELVIGDDFSEDNSLEILKNFSFSNTNISVNLLERAKEDTYHIQRKKLGRLHNFIDILDNCKGKYIALLDGDDYWTDPLKLQKQVDFLESHSSYSGSFHDTLTINQSEEKPIFKPWRVYDKNIFNLEDTISSVALFHTSSFVFRKSFLEIPEWFTKVQSADMALFSIISNKGPLYRIDESMSVYRKNEGGITNTITLKSYHSNRIKLFKYLKSYCKRSVIDNINQVILFHSREIKKLAKPTLANRWKRRLIKLLK